MMAVEEADKIGLVGGEIVEPPYALVMELLYSDGVEVVAILGKGACCRPLSKEEVDKEAVMKVESSTVRA